MLFIHVTLYLHILIISLTKLVIQYVLCFEVIRLDNWRVGL